METNGDGRPSPLFLPGLPGAAGRMEKPFGNGHKSKAKFLSNAHQPNIERKIQMKTCIGKSMKLFNSRIFRTVCIAFLAAVLCSAVYAAEASPQSINKAQKMGELNKELSDAVTSGDAARVEQAIAKGADPSWGLMAAVRQKNKQMADLLISKGAKLENGLMAAADNSGVEMADYLLSKGAKPDNGLYPAVSKNNLEMVKYLLSKGAKPTNVHFIEAVDRKNIQMIDYLISKGAKPDDGLYFAISSNNVEMVKYLLFKGAKTKSYYISTAQKKGYSEIVELLNASKVQSPSDSKQVDKKQQKALASKLNQAVLKNDLAAAGELISQGANPNDGLSTAIYKGNVKFMEFFLSKGASPNKGLSSAVYKGDAKFVEFFLSKGAKPNKYNLETADKKGLVAIKKMLLSKTDDAVIKKIMPYEVEGGGDLFKAIFTEDVQGVRSAIASGSNVNTRNKNGKTALMLAIEKGNVNIVELLTKAGADVNVRNKARLTPLMIAAEVKEFEIAKVLIAAGAQVNAKGPSEKGTPLVIAVREGDPRIVKLLIDSGASVKDAEVNDCVADGTHCSSILGLAVMSGNVDVVKILLGVKGIRSYRNEQYCGIGSAFWVAVETNQPKMLKLLDDNGLKALYNRNAPSETNMNSDIGWFNYVYGLMATAAERKQNELFRLLVDIYYREKFGDGSWGSSMQTTGNWLLDRAGREGQVDLAKLLIERNVKSEYIGMRGDKKSALITAAANGKTEIVKLLIDSGANVDEKELGGFTALMRAAQGEHIETVKFLHEACASLNEKNDYGKTALDFAEKNSDTAKFLRSIGAKSGEEIR